MARAVTSHAPERCSKYEPLYEIDPHTGACIEVFYADGVLAKSFGIRGTGWCLVDVRARLPAGPGHRPVCHELPRIPRRAGYESRPLVRETTRSVRLADDCS
jgi:hypothetical protein